MGIQNFIWEVVGLAKIFTFKIYSKFPISLFWNSLYCISKSIYYYYFLFLSISVILMIFFFPISLVWLLRTRRKVFVGFRGCVDLFFFKPPKSSPSNTWHCKEDSIFPPLRKPVHVWWNVSMKMEIPLFSYYYLSTKYILPCKGFLLLLLLF